MSASAFILAQSLTWLSGCWTNEAGTSVEVWSRDYSGFMFAHSVSERDDQVRFFEQLRIQPGKDGAIYVATPAGQETTAFMETTRTDTSITFENPDHDYPQRISYRLDGDTLTATISLFDGSEARDFVKSRCKTPAGK